MRFRFSSSSDERAEREVARLRAYLYSVLVLNLRVTRARILYHRRRRAPRARPGRRLPTRSRTREPRSRDGRPSRRARARPVRASPRAPRAPRVAPRVAPLTRRVSPTASAAGDGVVIVALRPRPSARGCHSAPALRRDDGRRRRAFRRAGAPLADCAAPALVAASTNPGTPRSGCGGCCRLIPCACAAAASARARSPPPPSAAGTAPSAAAETESPPARPPGWPWNPRGSNPMPGYPPGSDPPIMGWYPRIAGSIPGCPPYPWWPYTAAAMMAIWCCVAALMKSEQSNRR